MKNSLLTSRNIFILITLLIAVAGGYLLTSAMHWGPWAFSDSAAYVSAARNFSAGRGFIIINSNGSTTPVTEFPPFYAIFLSFFIGQNGDPNVIIPWLNVILFSLFLFSVGSILFSTFRNHVLALAGMLFCLFSPILLEIFSGVMSETLFFPLLFIIIFLAILVLKKQNESLFILLIVLSCLLPITRYAGILFVAVIALFILIFYPAQHKEKWLHALSYGLISLLPVGVWFLRLYTATSKVGGKHFRFDWSIISNFWQSILEEFTVLKSWLPYFGIYANPMFDRIISMGAAVLLIAIIVYLIVCLRKATLFRRVKNDYSKLFLLMIVNLCAYLLFIALTHTVTVPQIDIINRMLAPVLPMAIILIISVIGLFIQNKHKIILLFTIILMAVTLRFNFYQTSAFIKEMHVNGHGYATREIRQSGIIEHIQALPDDQRLVSNAAGFVLYYTNRFPIQVDQFANRTFGTTNGYGEKWFREKGAALILLYPDFRNFYGNAADPLLATVTNGLVVDYQDAVGGIYSYPVLVSKK